MEQSTPCAARTLKETLLERALSRTNGGRFFSSPPGAWRQLLPAAGPCGKPRVIHFVTGGFSGATQVAIDLVEGHLERGNYQPLLVLRKKKQTDMRKVQALRDKGLSVILVSGLTHQLTIAQLERVCQAFAPDLFVAHGFSDHIWGRMAAIRAGVPHLVHVEHNTRERYTPKRLAASLALAEKTDVIVGCSQGVKARLLELGFPAQKVVAINNGVRLAPFAQAHWHDWCARAPGVVMAARFSRQKDHATLLKAMALLRDKGLTPPVYLAGGGKQSLRAAAQRLSQTLKLDSQVQFLGLHPDVPGLYMGQKICVLSTHYEGMPLSLIEGMAAGCVVIASDVPGVRELIAPHHTGLLVPQGDAQALADAIEQVLGNGAQFAPLADHAMHEANAHYSLGKMLSNYENLFNRLIHR